MTKTEMNCIYRYVKTNMVLSERLRSRPFFYQAVPKFGTIPRMIEKQAEQNQIHNYLKYLSLLKNLFNIWYSPALFPEILVWSSF